MHLEVRLLQDAGQLGCQAAALRQMGKVPQDLPHQLQVVVTHSLQLCLLQPLMGLGVQTGEAGAGEPTPCNRLKLSPPDPKSFLTASLSFQDPTVFEFKDNTFPRCKASRSPELRLGPPGPGPVS